MNARLDEMIHTATTKAVQYAGFTNYDNVQWLCTKAQEVFVTEPSLLELEAPINLCGDLHGKFSDLLRAFQIGGMPPSTKWLFLGDYVDRGSRGFEVLCLLFALKLRYPNHVFLLRGNHETEEVSRNGNFYLECKQKLKKNAYPLFCSVFDSLPIGALIDSKIFCLHGGLSPHLSELSQIALIDRPIKIPNHGFLTDLLWSDPNRLTHSFSDSPRGNTVNWGHKEAAKFLKRNNLKMLIRGHQVAENGYDFPFYPEKDVLTLFTASCFVEDKEVHAAIMTIQSNLTYTFSLLRERKGLIRKNSSSSALKLFAHINTVMSLAPQARLQTVDTSPAQKKKRRSRSCHAIRFD